MRVCIIVEGAYPYVTGGVSAWLHQLMLNMPEVEFVLQIISSERDNSRAYKYEIPKNVVEIHEIFMFDYEHVNILTKKKLKLKKDMCNAFESLIFGKDVDWGKVFNFFRTHHVSVNSILSGSDFFKMVSTYHEEHFSGIPFTDFLWSMRSMYLPLFTILNTRPVKADVYHCLSSGYSVLLGCMQKKHFGSPCFLTEHGIYLREREEELISVDWVEGIYKDIWINQFNKLGMCGYDYSDKVSSLFEGARHFQIELGCDKDKTEVIPNGVDLKRYENIKPKDKDDKYINIGVIARIARIKDLKTMIVAFSNAKEKDNRLKLWIMGPREDDLEYSEECDKLIEKLRVKDIIFTGNVNVVDYIGKMDFLLLSSISEGQPLVILEAFAAKKPFISTNVGNCKGLIEGEFDDYGRAGYVVPVTASSQMAYAILNMAKDEEMRVQMGEIGYKRAHEFYDKDVSYARYFEVYKELIENNKKSDKKDGI